MKYKFNLVWIGLATVLVTLSCKDIVKIRLPLGTPTLSVDGTLTNRNQGSDTIKLSSTANYFSDSSINSIKDAKVVLTDSGFAVENLVEVAPGKFPIENIVATLNHTYFLDIYFSGEHFRAETHIKRLSPSLDSIRFQYEDKSIQYDTAGYYVFFFGQELPGIGDNVWIRIYKNNRLYNQPQDLIVFNDDFTDGKYFKGVSLNASSPFKIGDKAKVEFWSISKDVYEYISQIRLQINNRGIFQTTPSNVPTNIINQDASSSIKATGFFIGSLVESQSGIIP